MWVDWVQEEIEGYRSVKSCYRSPNDGILAAHIAQVAVSFRDKKKKKRLLRQGTFSFEEGVPEHVQNKVSLYYQKFLSSHIM